MYIDVIIDCIYIALSYHRDLFLSMLLTSQAE